MLGPAISLMLDFGYRWQQWRGAAWLLERIADCDICFAEATLHRDDLEGLRHLAQRALMRISGAETAATPSEVHEQITIGSVDAVQPDIRRADVLTEMARIADYRELTAVLSVYLETS